MSPSNQPEYFGKDLEAMSFAKNYYKWILSHFIPYIGPSVAEVGAGTGTFSKLLLETNILRLTAFEPSYNMYSLLKKTLENDTRARAVNDFFGKSNIKERFDSVFYVNVLEHIEDDASELSRAHKFINPNGYLLLFVPALPFLYSCFDKQVGHYRRYTKRELVKITQESGFSVIKVRYFDIAGVIPWYINFVLLKSTMFNRNVVLYDTIVVPMMRIVENLVVPPIGKNLLLVGKKSINKILYNFQ